MLRFGEVIGLKAQIWPSYAQIWRRCRTEGEAMLNYLSLSVVLLQGSAAFP